MGGNAFLVIFCLFWDGFEEIFNFCLLGSVSITSSVSHYGGRYETLYWDRSQADGHVWHHLALGCDAKPVDDDRGPADAPHRGCAGDEGRHAERLGHHTVLQSLVRHGHILRLEHRLPHSQLDVGGEETQLT